MMDFHQEDLMDEHGNRAVWLGHDSRFESGWSISEAIRKQFGSAREWDGGVFQSQP
jgi:hypothetical protein